MTNVAEEFALEMIRKAVSAACVQMVEGAETMTVRQLATVMDSINQWWDVYRQPPFAHHGTLITIIDTQIAILKELVRRRGL